MASKVRVKQIGQRIARARQTLDAQCVILDETLGKAQKRRAAEIVIMLTEHDADIWDTMPTVGLAIEAAIADLEHASVVLRLAYTALAGQEDKSDA